MLILLNHSVRMPHLGHPQDDDLNYKPWTCAIKIYYWITNDSKDAYSLKLIKPRKLITVLINPLKEENNYFKKKIIIKPFAQNPTLWHQLL